MGRHARGARLQRVPIATIVLGGIVVAVLGVSTFVGMRNQATSATTTADASAVVVSSPACDPAGGRTVVDVLDMGASESGGTTRAELAGCGYREGQVLAVRHAVGDPTQLAITDVADTSADLHPLGMLAALLLAIAAAAAVWYDGRAGRLFRRGRRIDLPGGFADSADAGSTQTAGWIDSLTAAPDSGDTSATRTGRHARIDPTDTEVLSSFDVAAVDVVGEAPAGADPHEAPPGGRGGTPEVDLVFAFDADFAASLRDELFTHRGAPSLP